jgi:serine/threonine-protein kinase
MATNIEQHPTAQELSDFVLGCLNGARRSAIESHVAECEQCCLALRSVKDDTFAERFKGSTPSQHDTRLAESTGAGGAGHQGVPVELQNHPRYRIVKELGRGGMGVVYLAEHTFMERHVALKVISRNFMKNSKAVERFRKEVKAAAKLTHANIVTAHDADESGGLHFLVMEYVEGINLTKLVQKRGPLTPAQVCHILKSVARGLQHAYEKKMVHRDIKPQNLLITKKGQIKVLDFGLAKLLHAEESEAMTDADMVLGTPDYIAPEQAYNSQEVDCRTDLYSLGCTAYYLLTGHPPYRHGTAMDKMIQHAHTMATPLTHERPEVPKGLADIVAKLMAKKPEHRFQTPNDLLHALTDLTSLPEEPLSDLESVEAPADTVPIAHARTNPNVRRQARRRPRGNRANRRSYLFAAGALLALVLLSLGGWAMMQSRRDHTRIAPPELAKNKQGKDQEQSSVVGKTTAPRVYLLLPASGFWYADYRGTYDALRSQGANVKVVSTRTGMAQNDAASGGNPVTIDVLLEHLNVNDSDALLVIGGTGVKREFVDGQFAAQAQQMVRAMLQAKKVVGSQCVGTELLAAADVCRGKNIASPSTEYQWVINAVQNKQGRLSTNPVEVDGPIVTARGPNDGAEFAAKVLQQITRLSNR